MKRWLIEGGVPVDTSGEAAEHLDTLHALYAPYLLALSDYLLMSVPAWHPPEKTRFNWRTTAIPGRHDGEHA